MKREIVAILVALIAICVASGSIGWELHPNVKIETVVETIDSGWNVGVVVDADYTIVADMLINMPETDAEHVVGIVIKSGAENVNLIGNLLTTGMGYEESGVFKCPKCPKCPELYPVMPWLSGTDCQI